MSRPSVAHSGHQTYSERLSALREQIENQDKLGENIEQEIVAAHERLYPGHKVDEDLKKKMTARLTEYRKRILEREREVLEHLEEIG